MAVVKEQELVSLYIRIAQALGAPSDEAEVFAHCMVRADIRGKYTQGAAIIPYSVWMIEKRLMRFGVPFTIVRDEPGLALVDGSYGVGAVVATRAMELAVNKARAVGVGCVWVQNGGDFMMAANHSLQALEHDMIGIVMRNGSPRVAPWGGKNAFFGTNPISIAIPTSVEPPIVIDTAAGSFSVGQIIMAARDQRFVPSPHLVTSDGKYTNDPTKIVVDSTDRESVFTGGIVTLGRKGLMWSLIVELFSGLLAGGFSSNMNDYEPDEERPWIEGMFLMAIDISKLQSVEAFKASADRFSRALRSVEPAENFERVVVPGEIEAKNEKQRPEAGIPLRDEDWQGVVDIAARLGINWTTS